INLCSVTMAAMNKSLREVTSPALGPERPLLEIRGVGSVAIPSPRGPSAPVLPFQRTSSEPTAREIGLLETLPKGGAGRSSEDSQRDGKRGRRRRLNHRGQFRP